MPVTPIPTIQKPVMAPLNNVLNWLIQQVNNQLAGGPVPPAPFVTEEAPPMDPTTRPQEGDAPSAAVPQTGQMSNPQAQEKEQREREEQAQRQEQQRQEQAAQQERQRQEQERGRDRRR